MSDPTFIAGVDIGSTAIRVAVGQTVFDEVGSSKTTLQLIGTAEYASEGITKGSISSVEDAVSSISNCLEQAERMIGSSIDSVLVGVSAQQVLMSTSKGVIAVSRPDGDICEDDVERVIGAAQTVAAPVNYEILHVIPKNFSVDGQTGIRDPIGMTGIRLEVEAQIIQGLSSHIKNLTKCVYRTGVNIDRLVLLPLALGEMLLAPRQKDLGVALLSIGSGSTSLAVFEQGDLLHLASIPIGSDHITADIAIGLRTSIDVAEKVKLHHANAINKDFTRKDEINLSDLGASNNENVSLKYISKIVGARLEELFEMVDKELRKVNRSKMLPAGVVLTGGGAKLSGIIDMARNCLELPVTIGEARGVSSITDLSSDPAFSGAAALVYWGIREHVVPKNNNKIFKNKNNQSVKSGFKKIFNMFY